MPSDSFALITRLVEMFMYNSGVNVYGRFMDNESNPMELPFTAEEIYDFTQDISMAL